MQLYRQYVRKQPTHRADYVQRLCTLWIMQVRGICSWWKYEVDEAKFNEYMTKFKLHQFLKGGRKGRGEAGRRKEENLLTFLI